MRPVLVTYLYCNTNLFFDKIESQPIKVFFGINQGVILNSTYTVGANNSVYYHDNAYMQKGGQIPLITISSDTPLQSGQSGFFIDFPNFNQTAMFWYWDSTGNYQKYNFTAATEYLNTHSPDFLILSPFAENGQVPVVSEVWGSYPISMTYQSKPLLHQTSYGVWEDEYYFDSGSDPMAAYDSTFLPANVKQIEFKIAVPKGYSIENAGSYKLENVDNGTTITQDLGVGDTSHVVFRDNNSTNVTAITGFLNPMIIGILLGAVITHVYEGKKHRRKRN